MMLPSPPNMHEYFLYTFKASTAHVGFFIHCSAPPSMLFTITLNANRSINEEFITTSRHVRPVAEQVVKQD